MALYTLEIVTFPQIEIYVVNDVRIVGLYDEDGDLVVISDSIPNDSVFTVRDQVS